MLRKLELKDIEPMMEWMQDENITCYFQHDFKKETKESVQTFIENSFNEKNQHFAFTDNQDAYLGTISLKNISMDHRNAEYAIVCRACAQGTGATKEATLQIIHYAFETLQLHKLYLNVISDNYRAITFYEKMRFKKEGTFKDALRIKDKYHSLQWYALFNE